MIERKKLYRAYTAHDFGAAGIFRETPKLISIPRKIRVQNMVNDGMKYKA